MNQASPQLTDQTSHCMSRQPGEQLPKVVIHFEVQPGATLSWRVEANAELQVQRERVWVTRVTSPYDYWLQPGLSLQLRRGERIWISTDANIAARLSLTAYPSARRGIVGRWLERLSLLNPDVYAPHSR